MVTSGTTTAQLVVLTGEQAGRSYGLTGGPFTMGRHAENDLVLADPQASRRHAQIVPERGEFTLLDLQSNNGTYLDGNRVQRAPLRDGSVITIGAFQAVFRTEPSPQSVPRGGGATSTSSAPAPPPSRTGDAPALFQLAGRSLVLIGRAADNDVVLDTPQVSRRHAQLRFEGGRYWIVDLQSTNGTFHNGGQVVTAPVSDGDTLQFGPYRYVVTGDVLRRTDTAAGTRIDCVHLTKSVANGITLLNDISFSVLPGELVAIVGGSGAGKSTLLDAVNGSRPATRGLVLYNGSDYYREIDAYRSSLGYVPQDDIVPMELPVEHALTYAAKLRLPDDTSEAEIASRVGEVMADLDLVERRRLEIRSLSGGQRKRVSIGAELLSKPSLLFMDEPTSGLDPGLEGRMMLLLRKLANQGRTVMLITHATQSLELCDQVLFLARGGQLAYYGPPREALRYFGVTTLAEIYGRLEQESGPVSWGQRFCVSPDYRPNVEARLTGLAAASAVGDRAQPAAFSDTTRPKSKRVSSPRQFRILTARYVETLYRDRQNLLLLLFQAPIIALLLALVFRSGILDAESGHPSLARTFSYLLVTTTVWFGTSNAAREIVKESNIYRRERRVTLRLLPYILSKFVVQAGLCFVQNLAILGIVGLTIVQASLAPDAYGLLFVTMMLIGLGGVALGLLLSALVANSDRAITFVPIVLIPQLVFTGAVVPLDDIRIAAGRWLAQVTIGKWGFESIASIVRLDDLRRLGVPPGIPGAPPVEPPMEFPASPVEAWFFLSAFIAVYFAAIVYCQRRKDRAG
ncbi:MAG: FHA domain-containing protein [Chloroflexi bacterium]|nr:FHA domain-containing protein [Chloroflexota bacterium]